MYICVVAYFHRRRVCVGLRVFMCLVRRTLSNTNICGILVQNVAKLLFMNYLFNHVFVNISLIHSRLKAFDQAPIAVLARITRHAYFIQLFELSVDDLTTFLFIIIDVFRKVVPYFHDYYFAIEKCKLCCVRLLKKRREEVEPVVFGCPYKWGQVNNQSINQSIIQFNVRFSMLAWVGRSDLQHSLHASSPTGRTCRTPHLPPPLFIH